MASEVTTSKITVIAPTIKIGSQEKILNLKKKKVAAYARVSTEQDEQQQSYEAQVDFYTTYIRNNEDWEFVEVYADEGISGTNTKMREGFKRMINDAKAGKIDLILTKSISRFARNTVDTLSTVRELKNLGIEVIFEKENLHTLDPKCEVMLTIMSSLAQEESRSISENVRWGKKKSMMDGKVDMPYHSFLGYRKGKDGRPEIVPEEAEIVQKIYRWYLEGMTINTIAGKLTDTGILTPRGKTKWVVSTVRSILSNEKYKGDALLQKSWTVDYLTKKRKKNEGELAQYYVKDSHPAIIDPDTFDLVQYEIGRRNGIRNRIYSKSPFSAKIICGHCGGYYGHKVHHYGQIVYDAWCCNEKSKSRKNCDAPNVRQTDIEEGFVKALSEELLQPETMTIDVVAEEKERERLEKNKILAEESIERVTSELEELVTKNAHVVQDQTEYREKHQKLIEILEDRKKALSLAEEAMVLNTARRVKKQIFIDAVKELPETTVAFSDTLFTKTTEKVVVKGEGGNVITLSYYFTNGEIVNITKDKKQGGGWKSS